MQTAQQTKASHQGGMMTRSRSKNAAGAPLASLESKVKTAQGPAPALPEESQAIQEVPNGPLVISAGWGRTGTSSLKVWPSGADAGHESAHLLHAFAPALQFPPSRPCLHTAHCQLPCLPRHVLVC